MSNQSNKRAVIIGAGPSGLFAARTLRKCGIKEIIILEKEPRVGGMCHSYVEQDRYAEYGAGMVFPSSREMLEAIKEKDILLEIPLFTDIKSISIYKKINNLNFPQKIIFCASFLFQLAKYFRCVYRYRKARDAMQPLPSDFNLPFAEFARKYGMVDISLFFEPYITGCGYGSLEECAAASLFEAMGFVHMMDCSLMQFLMSGNRLYQVKGGMQSYMEKIAEDFEVQTSVKIIQVIRDQHHVQIQYQQNHHLHSIEADMLVLAISPLHWKKIGLSLTAVELKLVDNLVYYHYPVAICRIKGIPAIQAFFTHSLADSKYTYLGFMHTQDCRFEPQEGRLCSVYISMPPGTHSFSFNPNDHRLSLLMQELKDKLHATEITVLDSINWEGYAPNLEWSERIALEKEQFANDTRTVYVGAYTLGCFETIASVARKATKTIEKALGVSNKIRRFNFAKPLWLLRRGIRKETLLPEEPNSPKN